MGQLKRPAFTLAHEAAIPTKPTHHPSLCGRPLKVQTQNPTRKTHALSSPGGRGLTAALLTLLTGDRHLKHPFAVTMFYFVFQRFGQLLSQPRSLGWALLEAALCTALLTPPAPALQPLGKGDVLLQAAGALVPCTDCSQRPVLHRGPGPSSTSSSSTCPPRNHSCPSQSCSQNSGYCGYCQGKPQAQHPRRTGEPQARTRLTHPLQLLSAPGQQVQVPLAGAHRGPTCSAMSWPVASPSGFPTSISPRR